MNRSVEHSSKVGDIFYRVYDRLVSAGVDEFDNPIGPGQIQLYSCSYRVTKVTPCGVWLDDYPARFILLSALRKHAHPTPEEAIAAYKARKNRQIKILFTQLGHAHTGLAKADRFARDHKF